MSYQEKNKCAGKDYGFATNHDKNKPAQFWFQNSTEGLILFIVFFTQACRWSKCLGCNLPSRSSESYIDFKSLFKQINFIFSDKEVCKKRHEIKKVILSNNGSILDQATFSSTALMYLLSQINFYLPNLSVLSIETRPEFVEMAELEFLSRAIKEGETPTSLEIAIGLEIFDEYLRNQIFQKGLEFHILEKFVEDISRYGFSLKCYVMQKPVPEMTDEEAIKDIGKCIDYLDDLAKKYGAKINLHLNPTYVASGTLLEKIFKEGNYLPPKLSDVAKAALRAEGKKINLYIGLYDEGLAVQGGSFIREGEDDIIKKMEKFNQTGNFSILKKITNTTES